MIKISQTKFGAGVGNCFASCVCCLLEIEDPESVPNFCFAADDWWGFFKDWMAENHQLKAHYSHIFPHEQLAILDGNWKFKDIKPPIILMGFNHEKVGHAVVYCPDNTIWNTNRTCKGLISVDAFVSFTPLKNNQNDNKQGIEI